MREFSSLGEFAVYMAAMVPKLQAAKRAGLKTGASIIQAEAKDEIGTYQGAAGPFAAWAPLAPATLAKKAADTPLLETGGLRGSINARVVSSNLAQVGSNDDKAIWQELGTKTIPPRSFLGHAAVVKENEVGHTIAMHAVAALMGGSLGALSMLSSDHGVSESSEGGGEE